MTRAEPGLRKGADGVDRCWWCGDDPLYRNYHDHEWGFPTADDRYLFEKLCLEGFQAGLSWLTVLRKRENFRRAFRGFEIETVARFTSCDVNRLLADAGIIRNRAKIESAINNARRTMEVIEERGALAALLWSFPPDPGSRPRRLDRRTLASLTRTPESAALSRTLKERGFTFVGPTTLYAYMQSIGLVNDHLHGCAIRTRVDAARAAFAPPN
ncbi:MAG: DNA-3-methyladenine glycosylase I [Planctomycetota bacterium]|nr:DNA-3-methyladenine glycosylase I [Planctomycetota bacterium]